MKTTVAVICVDGSPLGRRQLLSSDRAHHPAIRDHLDRYDNVVYVELVNLTVRVYVVTR